MEGREGEEEEPTAKTEIELCSSYEEFEKLVIKLSTPSRKEEEREKKKGKKMDREGEGNNVILLFI
ncbi:hypothetical protein SLEP1_g32730 [Rubroshorea leprosula]|uniref:Uncharacterized protein n=1 Tax=Rubroshorea leprosula TaxID=152421 RepID=A0AAV5KEF5_9ROSI|nr:hypothetical protein SLEP1_g32730 [Rubroshorea leprosula]